MFLFILILLCISVGGNLLQMLYLQNSHRTIKGVSSDFMYSSQYTRYLKKELEAAHCNIELVMCESDKKLEEAYRVTEMVVGQSTNQGAIRVHKEGPVQGLQGSASQHGGELQPD